MDKIKWNKETKSFAEKEEEFNVHFIMKKGDRYIATYYLNVPKSQKKHAERAIEFYNGSHVKWFPSSKSEQEYANNLKQIADNMNK